MKNNLTLLYVEDDTLVRENFTEIFQTYFKIVITTDNGDKALELYEKNHIDVAILDVQLNGLDGISVATHLREKDTDIVLLMISAYSDAPKLLRAINLKLFGYLVKPITFKEIDAVLTKIITMINAPLEIILNKDYTWKSTPETLLYNDEKLKLTKKEIEVIKILLENKNSYMTACEIQTLLFNDKSSSQGTCNNVVQLLSRFKKKIQNINANNYFIQNCYGVGYRISI